MKKKELVSDERTGEWMFGEVEDRNFIRHDDLNWEQRRWELFNSAVSGLSQRVDLVPSDVVNLARDIVDQGIDSYIGFKKDKINDIEFKQEVTNYEDEKVRTDNKG